MGSTRAALRAGIQQATAAVTASNKGENNAPTVRQNVPFQRRTSTFR
jgi:hypothetical protein